MLKKARKAGNGRIWKVELMWGRGRKKRGVRQRSGLLNSKLGVCAPHGWAEEKEKGSLLLALQAADSVQSYFVNRLSGNAERRANRFGARTAVRDGSLRLIRKKTLNLHGGAFEPW
jgi:hypothetical protein